MSLPNLTFAILDTETTGFVPRVHRVIELAVMRVENGKGSPAYEALFGIGAEEIPPHVRVLTRISQESLKDKPRIGDDTIAIQAALKDVDIIVGQNIPFDLGMLKGEGIDLTDRPSIDTSMLAALVFPDMPSFSLQYMSRALNLNHEPAHRAMGDVRATTELLERCWDRLLELPAAQLKHMKTIMERAPEGYRLFFGALPDATASVLPSWFTERAAQKNAAAVVTASLATVTPGTVLVQEEHVTCPLLEPLLAMENTEETRWVAVKNVETAARTLHLPASARLLLPPQLLLNDDAAQSLLTQEIFTADEATIAVKLRWFSPKTRLDVTLHAGERAIWNGKLACTENSAAYRAQFLEAPKTCIVDHRQLLSFVMDREHPAHAALKPGCTVIIDDASMLEDTATKAYGDLCPITDLRAAAEGNDTLTRWTDLLELWAEATRRQEDVHYLTKPELDGREVKGLLEQMGTVLQDETLPDRARHYLQQVAAILDPTKLTGRIVWIENMKHGAKTLHAVPERVDALLAKTLYTPYATTLIAPSGGGQLPEIVPSQYPATVKTPPISGVAMHVTYPASTLEDLLKNPPTGKTIALCSSKRMIEDWYVKYAEKLEEKGIALICQGLSGGQGRMEESFMTADAPAVWILTPWMYEGIELPPGSADRLVIDTLPFDHPAHAVLSIRARHFRDAFDQYSIPRLRARLFRLLRTFGRHRTATGDVLMLDKRLDAKAYGRVLKTYIEKITAGMEGKPTRETSKQPTLF